MNNECGFTCRACGQFRPGAEGAHSEAACLRVQLAAANERANRYHRDAQKMSASLTAKMEATAGHSFGRTLANVGYHAERLRRIDTEAALREANERAGRLEKALTLLVSDLDKCPTRQRGGASGQTVENNTAGTYITGLPVACVERARKALEVPDAL